MQEAKYIVRKGDGSWAVLVASEDQARQSIAEHEPDEGRRSVDYTVSRIVADRVYSLPPVTG